MGGINSKLWDAVQGNDPIGVQEAVNSGADSNATTQFVRTRGKFDAHETEDLQYEIEEWCPIHFASDRGFSQVVYVLLQNKADISRRVYTRWATTMGTKVTYEQTALHLACRNGHTEVVEVLLSIAPVEAGINGFDFNILQSSPQKKHNSLSNLQAMLKKPYQLGYTPLHYAVMKNNRQIIELLLFHGANVCAEGSSPTFHYPRGWASKTSTICSPIAMALKLDRKEIATLLCHGAEVTDEVLIALILREKFAITQFIAENGANYTKNSLVRKAALDAQKNKVVLQFMGKCLLNFQTIETNRLLFQAALRGIVTVIEFILFNRKGMSDDYMVNKGNSLFVPCPNDITKAIALEVNVSPIHAAVFKRQFGAMALLLSHSEFNVDGICDHGVTPLHLACILGCLESVKQLIAHGANKYLTTVVDFNNPDHNHGHKNIKTNPNGAKRKASKDSLHSQSGGENSRSRTASASKSSSSFRKRASADESIGIDDDGLKPHSSDFSAARLPRSDSLDSGDPSHRKRRLSSDGIREGYSNHNSKNDKEHISQTSLSFGVVPNRENPMGYSDFEKSTTRTRKYSRSFELSREEKPARNAIDLASAFGYHEIVSYLTEGDDSQEATIARQMAAENSEISSSPLPTKDKMKEKDPLLELSSMLRALDLGHLMDVFSKENINDMETLQLLEKSDFRDMGIKLGDVAKLQKILHS